MNRVKYVDEIDINRVRQEERYEQSEVDEIDINRVRQEERYE